MHINEVTGYPSKDRPWLKYYSDKAINSKLPVCSVYEYMVSCNKERQNEYALDYFGVKITYKTMLEKIDLVANSLLALGIKPGEIITMCVTNTPEAVYCFYAANKIGAISNFIDLRSGTDEFKVLLNETTNRFLFVLDVCSASIAKIISETKIDKVVVMSAYHSMPFPICRKKVRIPSQNPRFLSWDKFLQMGKRQITLGYSECNQNSIATIAHTGGTTGKPKGVMISNQSLNCVAFEYMHSGMAMQQGQRMLTIVPPFILNGLCTCLNMPLVVGLTCILIPQFKQKDFHKYLKKKPEHVVAAPTWWERLALDKHMENFNLSFLQTAATGGDGITRKNEQMLNEFFHKRESKSVLINGYGMTEIGSSVCTGMNHCYKLGSVGIPLPKMTISAFDENGNELPYGKQGELCVNGPSIMTGYYEAARETDAILKVHADGLKWVHTGDLGHVDKDGFVFVDGRIKRIIIREGGFKVFPSVIENIICQNNDVQACAVVGYRVDANLTGEVPVAFIVAAGDKEKIKNDCLRLCEENLGSHYYPQKLLFINELPITPVGKVDYQALKKEAILLLDDVYVDEKSTTI